jgi:hypothetical protein
LPCAKISAKSTSTFSCEFPHQQPQRPFRHIEREPGRKTRVITPVFPQPRLLSPLGERPYRLYRWQANAAAVVPKAMAPQGWRMGAKRGDMAPDELVVCD